MGNSEILIDGMVGPSHHFGGLASDNPAAMNNAHNLSNPRAAALQGLEKMRLVQLLGGAQVVLPPHPRPHLRFLRSIFPEKSGPELIGAAVNFDLRILSSAYSASSMWAANAATVFSGEQTADGKVHVIPANLVSSVHRSLEAEVNELIFKRMFNSANFHIDHPLPSYSQFGDEGDANHLRLTDGSATKSVFGFGSSGFFPPFSRQTELACDALIARAKVNSATTTKLLQGKSAIQSGAFHVDGLAINHRGFLIAHESVFERPGGDTRNVATLLGKGLNANFKISFISNAVLPLPDAVRTFILNAQVIDGTNDCIILVPQVVDQLKNSDALLSAILEMTNGIATAVKIVDLSESLKNGGGPSCLRLRVPMRSGLKKDIDSKFILDDILYERLKVLIQTKYRDRLSRKDLCDPLFFEECRSTIMDIGRIFGIEDIYETIFDY